MRKALNRVTIAGRVYDVSEIAIKTVQDTAKESYGTEYINGTLSVATDEDCLNVVDVHFTYVTATTKAGKANATFSVLKNIIENPQTVLSAGKENATCVKIDTALGLNDFYSNRNGEETLVSAKRIEGGFVTKVSKLPDSKRSSFECDMLINGTRYVEADPEKNIEKDYLVVKGAVFDFRKAILPVEFIVKSEGGIKYFESLDASAKNLTFTKVWGSINCSNIVTKKEEESAFGEPIVKEYTRTVREWVIEGTSKADSVYEIGDAENGITQDEIKEALANREVYLADVKKRQDEYQASKKGGSEVPFAETKKSAAPTPAVEDFNF